MGTKKYDVHAGVDKAKDLPIRWVIPPEIISRPATMLTVQHSEHEVILSFFDMMPPIIIATSEEQISEQLKKVKDVEARCVARLVVPASRYPQFAKVIQQNLEKNSNLQNESPSGE